MDVVPTEALGGPSPGCPLLGTCQNAYPLPNDALNPQPYVPGSYTRDAAVGRAASALAHDPSAGYATVP